MDAWTRFLVILFVVCFAIGVLTIADGLVQRLAQLLLGIC